jgi:hypothetical protein
MKLRIFTLLTLALVLTACGGGKSSITNPGSQKVIDPSGNWAMTATDSQGNKTLFAAMYNQVGQIVTANSWTAYGNSGSFSCTPLNASLSSGLVANVSNFTGTVALANFGTFTFNTTLNDAGTAFTGTYAGLPTCSGTGATGTFSGNEVPSVSGNWTGTIQPCDWDGQVSICTIKGSASSISFALTQNDATGAVTGTYQTSGVPALSGGTVGTNPTADILSGQNLFVSLTDANGAKSQLAGGPGNKQPGLGFDRSFKGILIANPTKDLSYFAVTISH